jgi:hypothetical protein
MRELSDGQYWIQTSESQEPEVARYVDKTWVLHGFEGAVDTADIYRIGKRVEVPADAFDVEEIAEIAEETDRKPTEEELAELAETGRRFREVTW